MTKEQTHYVPSFTESMRGTNVMKAGGLCLCGCGQDAPIARNTDTARGYVKGRAKKYIRGHARRAAIKTYRVASGERNKRLHVVRAECALGKPLPAGAEVHHADGSKSDDAPLVICQDHAYHMLLHKLARVLKAGGEPFAQRICCTCHRVLPFADFMGDPLNRKPRRGDVCRQCGREGSRRQHEQRRAKKHAADTLRPALL